MSTGENKARRSAFRMAAETAWLAYQTTGRPSRIVKLNGRWRVINAPTPPATDK